MIKFFLIVLFFIFVDACVPIQELKLMHDLEDPYIDTHEDIKKEIKLMKIMEGEDSAEIQYLIFLDGTLYYEEGKFDQAFKMFEKAYYIKKDKIIGKRLLHYYKEYSEQLLNEGLNDEAFKYLQKYVQLNEELRYQQKSVK